MPAGTDLHLSTVAGAILLVSWTHPRIGCARLSVWRAVTFLVVFSISCFSASRHLKVGFSASCPLLVNWFSICSGNVPRLFFGRPNRISKTILQPPRGWFLFPSAPLTNWATKWERERKREQPRERLWAIMSLFWSNRGCQFRSILASAYMFFFILSLPHRMTSFCHGSGKVLLI